MKSTRNPFFINIGFLINQPIGYSRILPIELDEMDIGDGALICDLTGEINLVRNQDGFRAKIKLKGTIDAECGRCLEPFQETIEPEFEEFFTFPFVEASDDEIQVPESGNINLEPILHDYILMEIPINPVCKSDCKGLCDICGINRNIKDCGHAHSHDDQPATQKLKLEDLKDILDT